MSRAADIDMADIDIPIYQYIVPTLIHNQHRNPLPSTNTRLPKQEDIPINPQPHLLKAY